jgi:hypothetical protein
MFGITNLELSDAGTECLNMSVKYWYMFYLLVGSVFLLCLLYLALLSCRRVHPDKAELNEKKLEKARKKREIVRREMMPESSQELEFMTSSFHNEKTAAMRGGRGVVFYFNWLVLGMLVSLTLAAGNFLAYELSDLGLRAAAEKKDHSCAVSPVGDVPAATADNGTVSTYMKTGTALPLAPSTPETLEEWEEHTVQAIRDSVRVFVEEAERTATVTESYAQAHGRFFKASIATYTIVVVLILSFSVYQLGIVNRRFHDSEPHARRFAAVVSGLPKDLFQGAVLTHHFRKVFDDKTDLELKELWDTHSGLQEKEDDLAGAHTKRDDIEYFPLRDRFWVVGTSIAYDFNLQQDKVFREIDAWVDDLENLQEAAKYGEGDNISVDGRWGIVIDDERPWHPFIKVKWSDDGTESDRLCTIQREIRKAKTLQSPATMDTRPLGTTNSQAVQTETRGDILEELRAKVPEQEHNPLADHVLLKYVGLEEDCASTLMGSGSAFVVFATEAARDAAVALAHSKQLPALTWPLEDNSPQPSGASKSPATQWKLSVSRAHCEPISVKWENFTPFMNIGSKIALGVLIMLITQILWICLALPSAMFIADTALIPGVRPSFMQNIILGVLIAVGNQLIALVVDKVTSWMGFLYKDSRDVAVLAFAFIGTLGATIFDLLVVAVTAHGMVLENAFQGRDAGYEPVVANEIFSLTVPGYLILPYLGVPMVERLLPFLISSWLIRSHGRVTLRSAKKALKSPEFDICWRYSDILNNSTICIVLLYFTSNRAWMVLSVLFLFLVIIYVIDKSLLLWEATPTLYDTHLLSTAFGLWWCLPTTMLAGLISYWGWRSSILPNWTVCCIIPVAHAFFFVTFLIVVQLAFADRFDKKAEFYPEVIAKLREENRPWDYFNTNPVYCLRTRYLGADETGYAEVLAFQQRLEKLQDAINEVVQSAESNEKDVDEKVIQEAIRGVGSPATIATNEFGGLHNGQTECIPFVRGSLEMLEIELQKQAGTQFTQTFLINKRRSTQLSMAQ